MTLEQLDKNSKYGYQRKTWSGSYYAAFNGTTWVFVSTSITAEPLIKSNAKADDWHLTNIPNKFYKRVAIVTKNMGEGFWPVGTRIIKTDRWSELISNAWILADYSNHSEEYYTLGVSCEWEDEMESEFPCFSEPITDNISCSSESIPTQQKQKENTMDLRLLLAMMAAMSNEETSKDATNSKHVVIVTKDDAYEGYFYADDLEDVKDIVAEPKNELKKFHVFDYQTTLAQKPRKVVTVDRC